MDVYTDSASPDALDILADPNQMTKARHNYMGHNCMAQSYVGQNCTDHIYLEPFYCPHTCPHTRLKGARSRTATTTWAITIWGHHYLGPYLYG